MPKPLRMSSLSLADKANHFISLAEIEWHEPSEEAIAGEAGQTQMLARFIKTFKKHEEVSK